ncbi:MAG: type II toxin-antitoxin system PemK/MazF family toxin [Acidobacteria bacterium]|nr:type II toxin-antitoxin system PemK/MazF family toxin [Acidobacteriota bacterium]
MTDEPLQWSVWLVDLSPVVGSEQAGRRPVVVVSREAANARLPVVTAVPLTSRKAGRRVYPNEALIPEGSGGIARESVAMAHQVRTVSKQRLARRLGSFDNDAVREAIRLALRIQLDL